jgi:hypothetical protein
MNLRGRAEVPARTPPQSNITALIFVVRSLAGFAALVTSIFSLQVQRGATAWGSGKIKRKTKRKEKRRKQKEKDIKSTFVCVA